VSVQAMTVTQVRRLRPDDDWRASHNGDDAELDVYAR
jgi:hypothetical protein